MITCEACNAQFSDENAFCDECGHPAPAKGVAEEVVAAPEPVEVVDPNASLTEQLTKLEAKKAHLESGSGEIENEIAVRENFIRQIDSL